MPISEHATSLRSTCSIYGIDFSGAKDAGKKIWIARGVLESDVLRIQSCRPAQDLPGSSRERDPCLSALRAFIRERPDAVFGLDFPFGLPAPLVEQDTWEAFILAFPERYDGPDDFKASCRRAAGGRELKRVTDEQAKTPFSPYNLWLYKQTYYGIREVLHPLVQAGAASALPMQEARPDAAWLLEICPASTLKDLWLAHSYKGAGDGKREARAHIVGELEGKGLVVVEDGTRTTLIEDSGGDVLDSVIAALAVSRALPDPAFPHVETDPAYALEGYVYG